MSGGMWQCGEWCGWWCRGGAAVSMWGGEGHQRWERHGMSAICVSVCDTGNDLGPKGGAAIAKGIKSCLRLTELMLGSKLRGHTW